jgi:hypothetical protein
MALQYRRRLRLDYFLADIITSMEDGHLLFHPKTDYSQVLKIQRFFCVGVKNYPRMLISHFQKAIHAAVSRKTDERVDDYCNII